MMSMDILKKFRRQVASFSLAMLIASTFAVGLAQAGTFDDVQPTDWFYTPVEALAAEGVLNTSFSNYRPGDEANRAEAATLLVEAFGLELVEPATPTFSDVPAGQWYYPYIETAVANGFVNGYKDAEGNLTGEYGPGDSVTRAQYSKMAVLAAPLAENLNLDPSFPDVQPGDWFYENVLTAFNWMVVDGYPDGTFLPDKPIKRGEIAKITYNAMYPEERTELPGVPSEAGDLSVALDGSSPDSMAIPQNGAGVLYSIFALSASSDEAVRIEQLTVSRVGLGLPGDFTNVKLYVDGVQKGGEKTINTTTNSATFNLSSDPIIVPAGTTVLAEVRADMNGATNSRNALCIAAADSLLAYGEATDEEILATGPWAVCGSEMYTTSATVGTLDYRVSQPSTTDINIGEVENIMTKIRMDVTGEAADVTRITFKQTGSADPEDFGNPELYMSGMPIDGIDYSWSGDFLTFDLAGNPIYIEKGSSKTVELWVDVVGGLNNTAAFDIYRDWHIEAVGQAYGYGLNVTENVASITPTTRNIVGGNVAFSASSSNPVPGDVAAGADDHEFLRFNISTAGEGVSVRKLSFQVNGDDAAGPAQVDTALALIDDIKVWQKNSAGTWVPILGPNDIVAGTDPEIVRFTETFDLPASSTEEFIVTGDVANTATAGDTYSVDLLSPKVAANVELEYSDGTPIDVTTDDVTGSALVGNWQTVATPSVTVSLAATPGNKTYVKNNINKDLVAFDFQASTADDIRVTGLTVDCVDNPDGTGQCSTAFQNVKLYLVDGSTITEIDGPRTLTNAGSGDGTVVFSLNEVIASGNSIRLLVRADVASAAAAAVFDFNIGAGNVTAEDSEGAAATVNGLATGARSITIAGAGTLTNQGVAETSTKSRLLVGQSLDEPVLKLRFAASDLEAWYVRKLRLINTNSTANNDSDVTKVYLTYNDGTGDYTVSTNLIAGIADFNLPTGHYIFVPANSNTTALVTVDVGTVESGGAVANDDLLIDFDGTANYEAVGASSATVVNLATTIGGNVMRVAKSAPVFAVNSVPSDLANTEVTLYEWTVTADEAGDIALKQFSFNVTPTGCTADDFRLFADDTLISDTASVDIMNDTTGADLEPLGAGSVAAASVVNVIFDDGASGGERLISAGNTVKYTLKATMSGVASGDDISTSPVYDTVGYVGDIDGSAADEILITGGAGTDGLVWSDMSDSPHSDVIGSSSVDWLNGWLVEGLSAASSVTLTKA